MTVRSEAVAWSNSPSSSGTGYGCTRRSLSPSIPSSKTTAGSARGWCSPTPAFRPAGGPRTRCRASTFVALPGWEPTPRCCPASSSERGHWWAPARSSQKTSRPIRSSLEIRRGRWAASANSKMKEDLYMRMQPGQPSRPAATIPLADLKAQHQSLGPELQAAIDRVFAASDFVLGEEVARFEAEFADYCGVGETIACANGTDALELALGAIGVGAGDEVITVANTFAATAEAIVRCGAIPRFVDVDPQTLLMDVTRLEDAITPRTRAIVPVHLYGSCVDIGAVMAIAQRHGIDVIEDAAQAQGARTRGKRAGATARAGCFSFYPGKNLGACGDAGGVVTSDTELANRMRQMRDHGRSGKKYEHDIIGRNSRMDGLQGAILRVKLRRLDAWNARRRDIATVYRELLAGTGAVPV